MSRIACVQCFSLCFVVATGCIFSSPVSGQNTNSAVGEHFLAAQQDQQSGRLDAAVHEYETVLHLQPGIPEVYANLGLVYYAQAKFSESEQAFATAAKLRPGMRGVNLWLGIDDVKLNRPVRGAALLRDAIRQNPQDKLAQSWLGTALWNAGQENAALLQFRAAAAQFPNDPDFLFALGEAYGKAVHHETESLLAESAGTALSDRIYADTYAEEHDWQKAAGHLRRAIERDPHSIAAHLELANIFFQQIQFAAAEEQLDQALALAPGSAAALARSGEVLILMRQPADGLNRIQKALDIDPDAALDAMGLPPGNPIEQAEKADTAGQLPSLCRDTAEKLAAEQGATPAGQAAMAALYGLAGDENSAVRAFRRMHRAGPDSTRAAGRSADATAALHRHRYDEAESELLRWLALHPQDREARWKLILARRHIAIEQIFRLVSIAPDSYHVHQLLGQLYVDRGEDNKAIIEYQAVAAARPDLPGVHFWLGHLYWKHADADHALAELTQELQLDPGHPEANGELGSILVAEGRAAEAIPHLELAIRSKPDLWPAYAQLGRAYASEKNYTRAEEVLRRALAHDTDGSAHYQLGLVLRAEGKTAQAQQLFAQVRAIKNESMAASSVEAGADHGAGP